MFLKCLVIYKQKTRATELPFSKRCPAPRQGVFFSLRRHMAFFTGEYQKPTTSPPWKFNSLSPEKWWLEEYEFLIFRGYVNLPGGRRSGKTGLHFFFRCDAKNRQIAFRPWIFVSGPGVFGLHGCNAPIAAFGVEALAQFHQSLSAQLRGMDQKIVTLQEQMQQMHQWLGAHVCEWFFVVQGWNSYSFPGKIKGSFSKV